MYSDSFCLGPKGAGSARRENKRLNRNTLDINYATLMTSKWQRILYPFDFISRSFSINRDDRSRSIATMVRTIENYGDILLMQSDS